MIHLTLFENYLLPYRTENEGMFDAAYFGKSAIRYRKKTYKEINGEDPVLEIHLDLTPEDQGKGKAVEMMKALIRGEEMPLWLSHGRVLNKNVYKVIDKLRSDPAYEVVDLEDGILII